ncbi:hypothetical protein D3C78_1217440 [compost metagenome]
MGAVAWIQLLLDFVADVQVQLLGPGALGQIQHAVSVLSVNIMQVHLAVVQPFAQRATVFRLVQFLPGFPHAFQRARRVFCRRQWLAEFVAFNANHVRYQHRMVRSDRTAGFGDHRRVR